MKRELTIPDPTAITPNTPLRLKVAVTLAFPDGGMTASGLRQEAAKGRLVLERIANKDFVTLAAIEEMRRLCAVSAGQISVYPPGKMAQERALASAARLISGVAPKRAYRGNGGRCRD